MLKLETILYPTDFSEPSKYAFEAAAAMALEHGSRMVIVHVAQPGMVYGEATPLQWLPEHVYVNKIWEEFHKVEAINPQVRNLQVETRIMEGDPSEAIINAARECGADMVIMGSHGRGGLNRLLMGSVAERVLRRAPCPVMVVKSPLPRAKAIPVAAV